jgi:hypothetical protein
MVDFENRSAVYVLVHAPEAQEAAILQAGMNPNINRPWRG